MIRSVFVLLLMFVSNVCFSQRSALVPYNSDHQAELKNILSVADIPVMEIDNEQLLDNISKNDKKLNWVILYSSECSGAKYAIEYANEMIAKYGDSLGVFMLAGDSYSNISHVKKELFKNKCLFQTYMISDKYGRYLDQSKKCNKFRKYICKECKKDIIGVPYNIVFDPKGNVIFHGFKSFRNKLPEDFISYLFDKNGTIED